MQLARSWIPTRGRGWRCASWTRPRHERLRAGDGPQECRVRMFGGLVVKVGDRLVSDRDWRKRKARLLFAMLALNQGQDLPRDQILEYLWPDMDDERARNNLYVIWSSMKSALTPEADKNTPCPYIDNSTGMCRSVAELIHSDVEEFESLVARAQISLLEGEEDAALERLREALRRVPGRAPAGRPVRGLVLHGARSISPGVRRLDASRRGDASDAGGCATRAQVRTQGAGPGSVARGSVSAGARCQIATGQRSAAVETFFACKDKLGEELGLDPSRETARLYDQVLAMEDSGDGIESSYC